MFIQLGEGVGTQKARWLPALEGAAVRSGRISVRIFSRPLCWIRTAQDAGTVDQDDKSAYVMQKRAGQCGD